MTNKQKQHHATRLFRNQQAVAFIRAAHYKRGMVPLTALFLGLVVLGTSFLSGIFGMLGGLILMGVLLYFLPVAGAMALHAITQMASNGWRAFLWRQHIMPGLLPGYIAGAVMIFVVFSLGAFALPKSWVFLFLGFVPYLAVVAPARFAPTIDKKGAPFLVGGLVMCLQLLAGVSGSVLDMFFVRAKLDRRQVVASKAITQTISHFFKLGYFTLVIPAVAVEVRVDFFPPWVYGASIVIAMSGTFLAKFVLERISNRSFQKWTRVLMLVIGAVYLAQGLMMLRLAD